MKKIPVPTDTPTAAALWATIARLQKQERLLMLEEAELFRAQKDQPKSPPLSDFEKAVEHRLTNLRETGEFVNGVVFAPTTFSRDDEIRIQRAALQRRVRELLQTWEGKRHDEAQEWGRAHAAEWRALARDIHLAGERLYALEEKSRRLLQSAGAPVYGLAMEEFIGDTSLLGIGDPLGKMREAALREGVVTKDDLEEARGV